MSREFREEFETAQPELWSYGLKRGDHPAEEEGVDRMWQPEVMVFVFLSVGAIALFSMISISTWSNARQKEREAYYKNDMLKKVSEAQGPGAASALELMREEARIEATRTRFGLQVGGLVTSGAGLGVLIFLRVLLGPTGVWLCGLIPLLIGIALYVSSNFVKTATE